ncbi:DUF1878 family protein [Bacillus marasmi]|uniref:DUF1878 family protein n=1 Tax=Bacillus marasmi TaxID=1926279 RepID=UPI0011C99A19|nr:DUF1878 family protein [Bacillus marasmi]
MNHEDFIQRLLRLEYHQQLLLNMVGNTKQQFFKLVIKKSLSEEEVEAFFELCENLSIELDEQKAEGFVHFNPLLVKFKEGLHPNLRVDEVIQACLTQQLYTPLMAELSKYL